MTTSGGPGEVTGLSPEDAFAMLGNETRLQILVALGEADEPLAFSELFERVDYDTTANFSYHLEKLEEHFVERCDDRYRLRRTGRRVVEAVLSGAVTEETVLDQLPVDTAAGPDVEILGRVPVPPAGLEERTPAEVLDAAAIWTATEVHATARGICPRCSAAVEHSVRVCANHDARGERCERCGRQLGATVLSTCSNCIYDEEAPFTSYLLADADLMAFMIDHGIDPMSPDGFHVTAVEMSVLCTEPFEARFRFTAEGDELVLQVDDELEVVDVTRRSAVERS